MVTCREMIETLADYLEGTMPSGARIALDRHLGGCPPCRTFLRTYAATIRLARTLACDDIPEDLKVRLAAFARRAPTR
jgi:predicted anti-sigma-YlaC factor YlaD